MSDIDISDVPEGNQIEGFDNLIFTREGRIFSKETNDYVSTFISENGYNKAFLIKNNIGRYFRIDNLIVEAFYHKRDVVIKHINNINHDDILENLKFKDKNIQDTVINGNRITKPVHKIDLETGEILETYISVKEAARQNNGGNAPINRVCNFDFGKYTAYGFGWIFSSLTKKEILNLSQKEINEREYCLELETKRKIREINNIKKNKIKIKIQNKENDSNEIKNYQISRIQIIIGNIESYRVELNEFPGYWLYKNGKLFSDKSKKYLTIQYRDKYPFYNLINKYKISKTVFIHFILAHAFIKNDDPINKTMIDHIDRDSKNYNLDNLRWVTPSENSRNVDRKNFKSNKVVLLYNGNGKLIKEFSSIEEASKQTGISRKTISRSIRGITTYTRYNGDKKCKWKLKNEEEIVPEPKDGRSIEGYDNYLITKDGKVYSKHIKNYMTTYKHKLYSRLALVNNEGIRHNFLIHRLINEAFDKKSDLFVNHKNGIRSDSYLDNLEYVTPQENTRHAVDTGLQNNTKPVNKLNCKTGELIETYISIAEAARCNNIDQRVIYNSLNNKNKNKIYSGGGFSWELADINIKEFIKNRNAKSEEYESEEYESESETESEECETENEEYENEEDESETENEEDEDETEIEEVESETEEDENDIRIMQCDIEGNCIKEFKNYKEASKKTNIDIELIKICCKNKTKIMKDKHGNKYTWRHKIIEPEGKQIPDFSGYIILANGKIYSKTTKKYRKPSITKEGFDNIIIIRNNGTKRSVYVHVLVMEAFKGKSNKHIKHINGNIRDNRLENLTYATHEDNVKKLLQSKRNFKPVHKIDLNTGKILNTYISVSNAAEKNNLDKSTISNVCQYEFGKYTSIGFGWQFATVTKEQVLELTQEEIIKLEKDLETKTKEIASKLSLTIKNKSKNLYEN